MKRIKNWYYRIYFRILKRFFPKIARRELHESLKLMGGILSNFDVPSQHLGAVKIVNHEEVFKTLIRLSKEYRMKNKYHFMTRQQVIREHVRQIEDKINEHN